ncbi:DUF6332 family protein [Streptomyces gibsoniae]|uniref:DUF6332 family protein n=1 Tax=Streptomyces gibsoniae TaxID=3075529 RepID=A0ABU2U864_9ACTN|nr:DUF6332 family protein [Streptomyces sp. DSM 41699]MDT0469430.1 DUF6332 family protein [Streptomyces sp. DSM 41699]
MENHGGRSPGGRRRRTQAERDAITVEIGYALGTAAFAAALLFGAVVGPVFVFQLAGGARRALLVSGAVGAVVLFTVRVVSVLVRFGRGAGGQPSQPGRTSPDS